MSKGMKETVAKELEETSLDSAEVEELEKKATREHVKQLLRKEVERLEAKRLTLSKQLERLSHPVTEAEKPRKVITTYAWDQNEQFVKVYIDLPSDFSGDQLSVELSFPTQRSFDLVFGNYRFALKNLNKNIVGSNSSFKLTKSRVIVSLKKEKDKTSWPNIQETKEDYKKAMDEEKAEMAEGNDPSASLMKLMKKMYDEGDDEMKRTISKSWYEARNKDSSGSDPTRDMPPMF